MIRKIFIIILTTVLGQIVYSCTSCFGEKNDSAVPFYDVTGYLSKTYHITGVNEHNSYEFEEIPEETSVEFDKLALSFYATRDYHASYQPSFLINTAYACDPLPNGYAGTKELLDSLVIRSEFDFNDDHLSGTELNKFFDVYKYGQNQSSLREYLNQDSLQAPEGLGLLLNTPPTASDLQKFIVTFYLSTGEVYKAESKKVVIH